MSLPPLDRLRLCAVGANGDSNESPWERKQRLVKQAIQNALPYSSPSPHIVCFRDNKKRSRKLAHLLYDWCYFYRHSIHYTITSELTTMEKALYQLALQDNPRAAHEERRERLMQRKQVQFKLPLPAYATKEDKWMLWTMKQRLAVIVDNLKHVLRANFTIGEGCVKNHYEPIDVDVTGTDDMGFSLTLIQESENTDNHAFRQSVDPKDKDKLKRLMGEETNCESWCAITLVYYMTKEIKKVAKEDDESSSLDEYDEFDSESSSSDEDENRGKGPVQAGGQNTMLLNLEADASSASSADTRVAFCPFKHGMITAVDGTHWHAVGPTHRVPHAALTLKFLLFKPKVTHVTTDKLGEKIVVEDDPGVWSNEEWWSRVEAHLRDMKAKKEMYPQLMFKNLEHGEATLRELMRQGGADGDASNNPRRPFDFQPGVGDFQGFVSADAPPVAFRSGGGGSGGGGGGASSSSDNL
jgi:hypothetical protein